MNHEATKARRGEFGLRKPLVLGKILVVLFGEVWIFSKILVIGFWKVANIPKILVFGGK